MRFCTSKLTAREMDDLMDLIPLPSRKHALNWFGHPANVEIWKQWAIELMEEHQPPLKPGDVVDPKTELWTILKGYMRSTQQINMEQTYGGCCCLSKTYFMPKGCGCKIPHRGREVPDTTQCSKCSVCLRCGKLLGIKVVGLSVNHHWSEYHFMCWCQPNCQSMQIIIFQGYAGSCKGLHQFPAIVLASLCMGPFCTEACAQ